MKQLELMVKVFLDAHSDSLGLYSYYDAILPCSPNRRRPDFVWLLPDRFVVLEVDEDAHRDYNRECEVARVTEVMEQGRALPLVLIRFNPKERLFPDLYQLLKRCFTTQVTGLLEVHFLGYKREYDVVAQIEMFASKRSK